MTPWWVRATARWRFRQLRRRQKLIEISPQGLEHVQNAVRSGKGVLICPNHAAHYDSAALYVALDRIRQPIFFLTAWQVFAMSRRWERWMMQRLGAFSINREGVDRQAFKQSIEILQSEPHPLVIFPEGDIYHTTDRVTPFREGAAAIALSAAKKADREIVAIPCGIRFRYVDDPTPSLLQRLEKLEERLFLRPLANATLVERVHRVAEGTLALKELDYIGGTHSGRVRDRIARLMESVLARLEEEHGLRNPAGSQGWEKTPERVKALRQAIISRLEDSAEPFLNGGGASGGTRSFAPAISPPGGREVRLPAIDLRNGGKVEPPPRETPTTHLRGPTSGSDRARAVP